MGKKNDSATSRKVRDFKMTMEDEEGNVECNAIMRKLKEFARKEKLKVVSFDINKVGEEPTVFNLKVHV
jgi:hypothetical protein